MKSSANRMTFWVTCVVDRTLKVHFRNCSSGFANFGNRTIGAFAGLDRIDSACLSSSLDSNQKRQVIYQWLAKFKSSSTVLIYLGGQLRKVSAVRAYASRNLEAMIYQSFRISPRDRPAPRYAQRATGSRTCRLHYRLLRLGC